VSALSAQEENQRCHLSEFMVDDTAAAQAAAGFTRDGL
jgi:hypothetical protein